MNAWQLAEEDHRAQIHLERVAGEAGLTLEARIRLEASERGLTFAQMASRYYANGWIDSPPPYRL
jgi:hypothetical protein